jgi:6-pyruvoyltetrahydropterin/6-carboxytetrahydropterin synthase
MTEKSPHTSLHLYKQNFKFSAAHFLIFDAQNAEKLHGHNYQVRVDFRVDAANEQVSQNLAKTGFFVDFNVFKQAIKARLDLWDEHVLLPAQHPEMKFRHEGGGLHVEFRNRRYLFPENEVILLPITNTSVEQMSRLLAEGLFEELKSYGVAGLRVKVEETRGQAASTQIG